MGIKEIHIEFTEQQIKKYNGAGFKLCFSCGMGENPEFNVIAKADTISSNVTITWNDAFKIAASHEQFMNGALCVAATNPASIVFDQVYTLPRLGTDGDITDKRLPGKSFEIVNDSNKEVSAVVYKRINGQYTPFYASYSQMGSQGSELLTPSASVALWFQAGGDTATMIWVNKGGLSIFDFSSQDKLNLKWDGSRFLVA